MREREGEKLNTKKVSEKVCVGSSSIPSSPLFSESQQCGLEAFGANILSRSVCFLEVGWLDFSWVRRLGRGVCVCVCMWERDREECECRMSVWARMKRAQRCCGWILARCCCCCYNGTGGTRCRETKCVCVLCTVWKQVFECALMCVDLSVLVSIVCVCVFVCVEEWSIEQVSNGP